jgi:hypothetical protein
VFHDNQCHHHLYETDCVTYSNFSDMEQLQLEQTIQSVNVAKLHSSTRHSQFSPEHISMIWNVGIRITKDILTTTTQKGVHHAVMPLSHCYHVDHLNLHVHYLAGKWTLDHIKSKVQSVQGHTGSFIFSNGNIAAVYPQATKNDANATDSLRCFCDKIRVPAWDKTHLCGTLLSQPTSTS